MGGWGLLWCWIRRGIFPLGRSLGGEVQASLKFEDFIAELGQGEGGIWADGMPDPPTVLLSVPETVGSPGELHRPALVNGMILL